ncbi:MAG: hypothetical protein MUO23_05500 [Anaerolineales bacterium]|nr:hypothetical protein [Anaerolineales bacterium]
MTDNEHRGERSAGEAVIAAVMAVVLVATAVAAWRASDLGSRAGDAERLGLIQSIQVQDFINVDWQKSYQEAAHAQRYLLAVAEVEAMEASDDAGLQAQAANQRKYVLSNLALLGEPLSTDPSYTRPDGSLDIAQRFADLQAENADLAALDPEGAFRRAELYHAEQRGYFIGTVLLALSLFWLGLGEITRGKSRLGSLIVGVALFLFGLSWIAGVEILWAAARWVEV